MGSFVERSHLLTAVSVVARLGATACVEGMLPACSCVCDRSDKRRKDTNKSEFDKEKTNRRVISTVNGCLVADKLSFFFHSKYEVVKLCT